MGASCSRQRRSAPRASSSASFPTEGGEGGEAQQPEQDYQPFPRISERDPFRLLGLPKDAAAEEVTSARNYLYEQYRWHEPSRDAIELAFDSIIQDTLKSRLAKGFAAGSTSRRGVAAFDPDRITFAKRVQQLFDPTVTTKTLINEGCVFGALAAWAFYSGDQSLPLVGAFAYAAYKFNMKRTKGEEGSAMMGSVFSTILSVAVACAIASVLTQPLVGVVVNMRKVSGAMVIIITGMLNVAFK